MRQRPIGQTGRQDWRIDAHSDEPHGRGFRPAPPDEKLSNIVGAHARLRTTVGVLLICASRLGFGP